MLTSLSLSQGSILTTPGVCKSKESSSPLHVPANLAFVVIKVLVDRMHEDSNVLNQNSVWQV